MRLIDADWLLSYLDLDDMDFPESIETMEKIDIKLAINDVPTEAVLCEDCEYYLPRENIVGFCTYGKCENEVRYDDFCSRGR